MPVGWANQAGSDALQEARLSTASQGHSSCVLHLSPKTRYYPSAVKDSYSRPIQYSLKGTNLACECHIHDVAHFQYPRQHNIIPYSWKYWLFRVKITLYPAAKVDSLPNSLCLYFKNMTQCDRKLVTRKYFLKTLGVIPVLIESIALACLQYSCMVHVCSIVQALPGLRTSVHNITLCIQQ